MIIEVGDAVPGLAVQITNAAGTAEDPTALALTITLPDGTTTAGGWPVAGSVTVTRASAGAFSASYNATSAGRHTYRWVATGANASAFGDTFHVQPSSLLPLISLTEIRNQCRASSAANDEELRWFGLVASQMAEDHTQAWRRQTLTETFDGVAGPLVLQRPVASVTTVTEDGQTIPASGYVLNARTGRLYRGTTTCVVPWTSGRQNIVVTYVAGPSDGVVPANILQGVRLQVQHLWDSQRGGPGVPRQTGADFTVDPRSGYAIPHRVLELWQPSIPMGGMYVA